MNGMMKQLVNLKINSLNTQELIQLGRKYGLILKQQEARQITSLIKQRKVNIFDDSERKQLLRKIAEATTPQLAREIEVLFSKFTSKK
ncbi:hypothetical protein JOD43_003204 [Pullulanibacillus pueri]|uniref:DUF2624 domain-containing protein n=1 Tax=Pullulanibacillus pueri TaxID=1437324 RepID=A0A8J2ZXY8_9BACL|nr:DUF2624 family protein [Pullulanibacillus pueri]MBM7683025.1 hypothetical protein [Pullulanibacillus pueri]GGH85031.1 hypothetical protein GCM10007096_29480 [Pullulanibacillus pueri]